MKNRNPNTSSNGFRPAFYGPRYWPTWLGFGCLYLIGRVPFAFLLKVGRLIGRVLFYLARERRRIAEINIRLCFPELSSAEQARLVRAHLCEMGINLTEGPASLWGPASNFRKFGRVYGLEHLEAARAEGQGVVLLGAHFTTIDVAGPILAQHIDFDVLYRTDSNPLIDYLIRSARAKYAANTIPSSDIRQMIKNLRAGNVIWYAPDQDYRTEHRVFAPFFGVPAATVVTTSRITRLGNAKVLPLSHYRDEQGIYHLVIAPALEGYPSGDDLEDATRINQIIEAAVRKYPAQYLWVHRRFKTRPPGEPSPYPPRRRRR